MSLVAVKFCVCDIIQFRSGAEDVELLYKNTMSSITRASYTPLSSTMSGHSSLKLLGLGLFWSRLICMLKSKCYGGTQHKPQPRRLISTKSDPDVCRIAPKMLWIHYLVGVSHFAECRENRPATVWEMVINLLKSPISQRWRKRKIDPKFLSGNRSLAKVKLIGPIIKQSFNQIGWLLLQ